LSRHAGSYGVIDDSATLTIASFDRAAGETRDALRGCLRAGRPHDIVREKSMRLLLLMPQPARCWAIVANHAVAARTRPDQGTSGTRRMFSGESVRRSGRAMRYVRAPERQVGPPAHGHGDELGGPLPEPGEADGRNQWRFLSTPRARTGVTKGVMLTPTRTAVLRQKHSRTAPHEATMCSIASADLANVASRADDE